MEAMKILGNAIPFPLSLTASVWKPWISINIHGLLSFTVCTLRKNLHWSRTNVSGDTGQTNRLSDDGASVVVIYSYFYNICIFLLY